MVAIIVEYGGNVFPSYDKIQIHFAEWDERHTAEVFRSREDVEWYLAGRPESQLTRSIAAVSAAIGW